MSYEIKVAFWQILTAFITIKIVAMLGEKGLLKLQKTNWKFLTKEEGAITEHTRTVN